MMHQKQNPAKFYTKGEEIFNAVSHGTGSVLAIGGTGALVALAAALADWRAVLICLVYGLSLVVPISDPAGVTEDGASVVIWDRENALAMFDEISRGDTSQLDRFLG